MLSGAPLSVLPLSTLPTAAGGATNTPINPGVGQIVITGYAPTIGQSRSVEPGVGQIAITGYAPDIGQSHSVEPSTGQIVITGYAPDIAQSVSGNVVPGVGNIVITGYAPTIAQSGGQSGWRRLLIAQIQEEALQLDTERRKFEEKGAQKIVAESEAALRAFEIAQQLEAIDSTVPDTVHPRLVKTGRTKRRVVAPWLLEMPPEFRAWYVESLPQLVAAEKRKLLKDDEDEDEVIEMLLMLH